METYRNINGDSNVEAYEIGSDFIRVKFARTAKIYQYSYRRAGRENVEIMKELARNGDGLNSFINKNVEKLYD